MRRFSLRVSSASLLLLVLPAVWSALASRVAAQGDGGDCDSPDPADFPLLKLPFEKACSSAAECPAGAGCEAPLEVWGGERSGPVCSDFSAEFLENCDNPNGPVMASPGCKQKVGVVCDVDFDGQAGKLRSAVCRKQIGQSCGKDSDCVGSWKKALDVVCVDGKCQQFGYVADCGGDGERCAGGQVCTSKDASQWVTGSQATFACFNRADRGDACKGTLNENFGANNGYTCKEDNETSSLGYRLFCDEAVMEGNDWKTGVCRSFSYEEGAECGANMLCAQMDCVNGKCQKRTEPVAPGNECKAGSDCPRWNDGVAPDQECKNGKCVPFGYVGECFKSGDKCPGGQTCRSVPSDNPNRNSCINRGAKGDPCKAPRQGPFNGYACKPKSETGYDMRCKFGADAEAVPGPGPGGIGGGIRGTGRCMQVVEEEGADCGDDKLLVCNFNSQCVNGKCQKQQ